MMTRLPRLTARRIDGLVLAIGLLAGGMIGLIVEPPPLATFRNAADAYLLAPLIAAVNAGISCF